MKKTLGILSCGVLIAACAPNQEKPSMKLDYPESKKIETVHEYFGTQVKDPYAWLEDDRSEETAQWVNAQNEVTFGLLKDIPFREKIAKRYEELFNYPKVSSPRKVGDYYFIYKNDGLQNQSVIYYKKGRDGEEKEFLNPNTMSKEGTTSIGLLGHSEDKKYLAYSRSDAGSDWQKIKVRDIANNVDLEDELEWVKFSGADWYKDGFFYSRYPKPESGDELSAKNEFHSVYYHKIGEPQSKDKLIYSNKKEPLMYHYGGLTEDKAYFTLYASTGTDGYELYYSSMKNGVENMDFKALFTGFENKSSVVDHQNGKFLVMTDIDAPKYKLVSIDLENPEASNWKVIIPETNELLRGVNTGGGYLWASYLKNATTKVQRYNYDGTNAIDIQLPAPGSAGGFGGYKDDKTLFYSFTSFTYPTSIFEYDIESGKSKMYYQPALKFNPNDYESKQVFYPSKDGTEVSMFIVHKKDLKLDGTNPTLLYGYGGFNVNLTPSFSTSNIILLENGGVYAMANLRGGGEYGEEWHEAGMLMKKQNVFDDFISAGEYLIKAGYTSSEKLAINGGSNGGLLVGACMTQRPDLFQVALPAVGVLDMLRYHKFTVGWGWVPEYGSSEQSKEMFEYLKGYSPLHNLKEGVSYPATMITTADHDDRVVPAHSFKFAARLQEVHKGNNPVLIRIETNAGHGAGKPTSKIIEEQADKWAFMFSNMGYTDLYPDQK